jgi:hypothetical protein
VKKRDVQITHAIGRHCGSSAIRDLLEFNGLTISEAMCLGLGSGLGVTYLELAADAPVPFLVHVRSLGFEARVFQSLGIPFEWQTFDSPELAAVALGNCLDAGRPTLLLTDIFYLPYFNSTTHFPGHAIAAWSKNPETGEILVTDTERPDVLSVSEQALTRARFSTQPPFIHHGNMFTPNAFQGHITPEIITQVIRDNASSLAAGGLSALQTWLDDLDRWGSTGDWHWTTRFAYQVIEKRGTGGGGFRKMYAEFLDEAIPYNAAVQQQQLPLLMRTCEKTWTALAMQLKAASESPDFPHATIEAAIVAVMQTERNYVNAALAL